MRYIPIALLALALSSCDFGGGSAGKSEEVVPESVAPDTTAAVDSASVIR